MSVISKCPRCRQQVTIPDGLDPSAEVRCPLCVVVYPLREALAETPPALIPVDTGVIAGPGPDSGALADSDLVSERFHVPGSADVEVADPSATEFDFAREAQTPDPATGDDASPAIDTGQTPVDTDALAAFRVEPPEGESQPSGGATAPRPRRRSKEKSPIRFLLEVFLGGIGGLLIGYYALCWALWGLGSQRNLPQLSLPLLPHTIHWWDGQQKPKSNPGQSSTADPDNTKPGGPARSPAPQPGPTVNHGENHDQDPLAQWGIRAGGLPAELPVAEPVPLPEGYVGPRARLAFTSDELGQALKAAHDALNGDSAGQMKAETYRKFCRMGHVLTFVEEDATDGRLASRKMAVRDVLKSLGSRPDRIARIEGLAGAVLEDPQSLPGGVLLAGTAGRVAVQGRLHGTVVKIGAQGGSVTVLADRPLPFAASDQVLILGTAVANPAENLVGYNGTKPLVIWVGTAVKLAQ